MTDLRVPSPLICLFSVEDIQIYDKISLKLINVVVFIHWIGCHQAINDCKHSIFLEQVFVYILAPCFFKPLIRRDRNALDPIIPSIL